jgi:hypothetical protein
MEPPMTRSRILAALASAIALGGFVSGCASIVPDDHYSMADSYDAYGRGRGR